MPELPVLKETNHEGEHRARHQGGHGNGLRMTDLLRLTAELGPGYPDPCGTPGTPSCPPPDVFVETRQALIDALAGADASKERRRTATSYVDSFLVISLDTVQRMISDLGLKPSTQQITIEIEGNVARIVVGPDVPKGRLAEVLQAFPVHRIVITERG